MIQNLSERGIKLYGITEFPSLDSQIERYKTLGFDVLAWDMNKALEDLVPKEIVEKWNRIERLDEVEEWIMFCNHYFILYAEKK